MPQNFNFSSPTRIAFGAGRIDKLGADVARLANSTRLDPADDAPLVLLISDPGVAEAGLTLRVAAVLEGAMRRADLEVATELRHRLQVEDLHRPIALFSLIFQQFEYPVYLCLRAWPRGRVAHQFALPVERDLPVTGPGCEHAFVA